MKVCDGIPNKERFIEDPFFPIKEVHKKSLLEKGTGRPPYWEMVFYWTRKPLIGARAIIAASLLPCASSEELKSLFHTKGKEETSSEGNNVEDPKKKFIEVFIRLIKLNERSPHRANPEVPVALKEYFRGKKLLDPFAGFGSIPLEGLRLGLDVTAVELLPTAYIFLKAILEYPKKFDKKLVKDVENWGKKVAERLKKDPQIKRLYDDDVAVYIGTWEIMCPHCNRYTPIIGNWWLARVKDSKDRKRYKRLVYLRPKIPKENDDKNQEISFEVIDLNEIFGSTFETEIKGNSITVEGEFFVEKAEKYSHHFRDQNSSTPWEEKENNKLIFRVNDPNVDLRHDQASCLLCSNIIKYVDASGRHYIKKPKGQQVEPYLKHALKDWNRKLEEYLKGNINLEELKRAKARPRILVKVKKDKGRGTLIFEVADEKDREKIWEALEILRRFWGDPDVPTEPVAPYATRYIFPILYGFDKWYKFFNPRQLLTLIKITKAIRDVGKEIEKLKKKEGWSEKEAFEYSEAITTYLSMMLVNYVDFNSTQTYWEVVWLTNKRSLAFRGISMMWNWCDVSPTNIFIVGSITKSMQKIIKGLEYLTSAIPNGQNGLYEYFNKIGNSAQHIRIIQGDATSLNLDENFDIIVTDPPYADDVPYSELSDFYYVWLKRCLSENNGRRLSPRYHKEAFFKEIKTGNKSIYKEIKVQWNEFAKKEVSEDAGRFSGRTKKEREKLAKEHFQELLSRSFISMRNHLKDGGLLVTYYAHTNIDSWIGLLEAGWRRAKLQVRRAFPLSTESPTNIVSKGKLSLDTSIVLVWKKISKRREEISIDQLLPKIKSAAKNTAKELLIHGHGGLDLLYGVVAGILKEVTKYDKVTGITLKELSTQDILKEHVYPLAIQGIIEAISEEAFGKTTRPPITSPYGVFYTTYKVIFGNRALKANDTILLKLVTGVNLNALRLEKGNKATKWSYALLLQEGDSYVLCSPDIFSKKDSFPKEEDLKKLLELRGLSLENPLIRCSVDALHLLEYYSLAEEYNTFKRRLHDLKRIAKDEVEEAISIAFLINYYIEHLLRDCTNKSDLLGYLKKRGAYEFYLIRRLVNLIKKGVLL